MRQTNVAMVQKLELDKLQKQLLEVLDKKNKEMEKVRSAHGEDKAYLFTCFGANFVQCMRTTRIM